MKISYVTSGKVKRSQEDGEVLPITYPRKAEGGCTDIAPLILTLGFRPEWDVETKHSLLHAGQRVQVPIVEETGVGDTILRTPDRPANRESLYRLSYAGSSDKIAPTKCCATGI